MIKLSSVLLVDDDSLTDGKALLEAYQRLPTAQQQAVVFVMHTASMSSVDLGRIEELPIAGLVSKPLTKAKMDTILQLHYQRQFAVI